MSWLGKLLGQGQKGKKSSGKSKSTGKSTRKGKANSAQAERTTARRKTTTRPARKRSSSHLAANEPTHPYRAVTIRSMENCCAAAERNTGQKFLAAHAPQLPLGTCDQPQQCRCRYKYLSDRRQETRRDVDFGLPGQPYHGEDRRYRRTRRKSEHKRTA